MTLLGAYPIEAEMAQGEVSACTAETRCCSRTLGHVAVEAKMVTVRGRNLAWKKGTQPKSVKDWERDCSLKA